LGVINGQRSLFPRIDRLGDRYFTVSNRDTLELLVRDLIFRFPVAGYDSLAVIVRSWGNDSLVHIQPVSVSATVRRRPINTGVGTIVPEDYTGAGTFVDVSEAPPIQTLFEYMVGRVAGLNLNTLLKTATIRGGITSIIGGSNEPLIVVDGIVQNNETLASISEIYSLSSIESVFVIMNGVEYGMRGSNGVIVITTKASAK
jgi:hypothetical protein